MAEKDDRGSAGSSGSGVPRPSRPPAVLKPGDFIQATTPGLLAVFREKNKKESTAPIVGYLIDAENDRIACVIGDGGRVVPAHTVPGFHAVRWDREEVITEIGVGRLEIFGKPGDSLFDRVFGRR